MEVAEVGAPGGKKVTRSLLREAKQVFILCHLFALHMCRDNLIFHGVKEGQSLDIACVYTTQCKRNDRAKAQQLKKVVCTCSG